MLQNQKRKAPGHHYVKKIDSIISTCLISGEMFHEYSADQTVPPTLRPVPDIGKILKFHYVPTTRGYTMYKKKWWKEGGNFQPRAR